MRTKSAMAMLIAGFFAASLAVFSAPEEGVNWPAFRGLNASGIAEGFATPVTWDVESSRNIKWKTEIPGLGHSSPIIWGNRLFVTTAVSGVDKPELKVGLYGNIQPVEDDTIHEFKVYCLDKNSGKILWERTSHKGVPKVKRHPKSTHANSTAATDGRHLAVFFGSEGLYCYDMEGKLLWKKDFGVLDSAFFMVPTAQWGFASSPVIHQGVVLIQADVLNDSFLAALDVETGIPRGLLAPDAEQLVTEVRTTCSGEEQYTRPQDLAHRHSPGGADRCESDILRISGMGRKGAPIVIFRGSVNRKHFGFSISDLGQGYRGDS